MLSSTVWYQMKKILEHEWPNLCHQSLMKTLKMLLMIWLRTKCSSYAKTHQIYRQVGILMLISYLKRNKARPNKTTKTRMMIFLMLWWKKVSLKRIGSNNRRMRKIMIFYLNNLRDCKHLPVVLINNLLYKSLWLQIWIKSSQQIVLN